MRDYLKTPMILVLFDGAAAAGGDGAAAAGAQGETSAAPGSTRRGKTGEFDNVVFGKQAASPQGAVASPAATTPSDAGKEKTGVQTTSDALEAKRAAFRQMVEGEYKDIYTQDVQRIIDRRFKETKTLQAQVDGFQPIIDMLAQRYGVDGTDAKAISAAIENDDAYWSEAAEEAGMTVPQFKEFQRLERENKALLEQQRQRQGEDAMQRQLRQWYDEADLLKQKFSGFDLNAEVQDPQFVSMLRSGVPMELAYKVIHMDAMMSDAMSTTAQAVERRVVNNVRAKGARPAENGGASQSAFVVKDDVSKLTRRDRAEIAKRVAKGEPISF